MMDRSGKPAVKSSLFFSMLLTISILPLISCAAQKNDWPHFRGPDRNGISAEKGWQAQWPKEGPKVAWNKNIGTGFSSFAVAEGRVYALGNKDGKNDTVYCLDTKTGKEIWTKSYPCELYPKQHEGGPAATPTVDGDRVYTISKEGDLFCWNTKNGDVIWSHDFQKDLKAQVPKWSFSASPVVEGERLIVTAGPIIAYDKKNGEMIWRSKDYKAGYSTPIVFNMGDQRCIADFNGDGLVIFNAEDGKEVVERYPWGNPINAAMPIVTGDKIFISSGYNQGAALLTVSNGKLSQVWKNTNMRNHMSTSVLWNDHVYGFDDKQLRCIDFNTGEPKWTKEGLGKGTLMLADGKLIILSEEGELVIAQAVPDAYKEISRAQVLSGRCWTVPVLAEQKIFCRNAKGDMVVLDVSVK